MICTVTSMPIKPGKSTEAKAITVKAAKYMKENHSGVVDAHILSNISGKPNRLHFVVYYESLAVYAERRDKINDDAQWQKLVAAGKEVLNFSELENSFFDVE